MGHTVGIDLGTTYCAVAIPEARQGEGYLVLDTCPGSTILLDRLGRRITPSVVTEDEKGNIIVGYSAKARAGSIPEPIAFSKRYLDTDTRYQLKHHGALDSKDVASHILAALKAMAESRLGDSVDAAVITVPAYFTLRQKQLTQEAAESAGLKVAQIAQEPVAAALMYCATDPRPSLRIMTYDLGGGTFDVAVLQKRDGVISGNSILAFGGHRFLGGYDFDKKLALWMVEQLAAKGYALDPEDPGLEQSALFGKLLVYAEQVKIELSRNESCQIEHPSTGMADREGNPIELSLEITRDEFEKLIARDIEWTIEICRETLNEKGSAPIPPESIDEIIMVGGSSFIPLVRRRLREAFGKEPLLVEPNLCVALGAGLLAGGHGATHGRFKLGALPKKTDLPSFSVVGELLAEGQESVVGAVVRLQARDGSFDRKISVSGEGMFLFDGVPLVPGEESEFVLEATSAAGKPIARHEFTVEHSEEATGEIVTPTNNLAKPVGVVLLDGFQVLAPARTPLPCEPMLRVVTADTSGLIRIPVREENSLIGEILMKDIPSDLPIGSTIEIKLLIDDHYQIRATAYVPAIAKTTSVVLNLPVPAQMSLDDLRDKFEFLTAQADECIKEASSAHKFTKVPKLRRLLAEAREMLNSPLADKAKLQDCLDEIDNLVQDLQAGWRPDPPIAAFEFKASQVESLLARAIAKDPNVAKEGYEERLKAIRAEANKAREAQNPAQWKEAYAHLEKLGSELERKIGPTNGNGEVDPVQLHKECSQMLAQKKREAEQMGVYERLEQDFKDAEAALQKIEPTHPNALIQIRDWYNTHYRKIENRIAATEKEGLTTKDPRVTSGG